MTPSPGVIIDGAVPRSEYERAVEVYDYLLTLEGHVVGDWDEENDPRLLKEKWEGHSRCRDDADVWRIVEDDIIAKINEILPDDYVCTVGEVNPGDVIVREIGLDEQLDQEGV